HPMRPHLGQGGCQAIEDAVLLGITIGAAEDLVGAFSQFVRRRRRRVRRVVGDSALGGRMIQGEGPVASMARRLVPRVPVALMTRYLAGIGGSKAFRAPRTSTPAS